MYYLNTQPIQRWTGAGSCCSTTVLNVCGLHTQRVVLLAACYLACAISYLLLIVLQEKKTISLLWTCPMRATLTMQLHWNWVGHTSFPIFFLHSTLLVCHRAPAFFFFLPLQVRILDYIQHLYRSYLIISIFLFSPLCILPVLKHTYKTGPTGMQWIPNTLVFFLGLFLLYLTDCKMLLNSDWAGYISELALTHGFSPTATAKLEPIVIFFP